MEKPGKFGVRRSCTRGWLPQASSLRMPHLTYSLQGGEWDKASRKLVRHIAQGTQVILDGPEHIGPGTDDSSLAGKPSSQDQKP